MHAQSNAVSGHVWQYVGKRGPVWYAKVRKPVRQSDGRTVVKQANEKIGPVWKGAGRPPAGHYTRKTAEAWLTARLVDLRRGVGVTTETGATFSQAADEFLRFVEHDRGRKPGTVKEYRSAVNFRLRPAFGDRRLEDVTTRSIEAWRGSLLAEGKLSRRTVNKLVTILHGVFERARRVYGLPGNPVADVERHPESYSGAFDFYSPEEVWALVRAADSEQDAAVFLTAAFTGLRRGELVALRWSDVDFSGEAIRVRASVTHGELTTPKSGKVRTVPMVAEVAQALARLGEREHSTSEGDLVFPGIGGEYLDGSALRRRYVEAVKRAGLRPLRFHDLRHCFGSLAINRASIVQVQAWMGHADVETTMRYLHHKSRADDARLLADAFRVEEPERLPGTATR